MTDHPIRSGSSQDRPVFFELVDAPGSQAPSSFGEGPRSREFEDEGVDWSRYLAAVARYRWLAVLGLVFGLAAAAGVWRFVSPQYVVQGSLWVQSDDGGAMDPRGPISEEGLLSSTGWIDLLR